MTMGLFRRAEQRDWTLRDPAFADFFGLGPVAAGVRVTESSSLGLTALYRAVSLTAGVIASMPLKTYRETEPGQKERLRSFLDNPAGPEGATPYEWVETVMLHLLLHGNAFLLHVYGGGGQILGLLPVHPGSVGVEHRPDLPGGKLFRVSLRDGDHRELTAVDMLHIPALATDGLRGYSPIAVARNAIGTGIAGELSASRLFSNGAMISGLVTPTDDLTEEEAKQIKDSLRAKMLGHEHAGDVAVINRNLNFQPWSMNAMDAQFIESRGFQIEEIARLYGLPVQLLAAEGASSWGSGIQELVIAWQKFTLGPWTHRIEQRLSTLLPAPRFVQFETKNLLKGSPADEITLLLAQVNGGLLSVNEARALMNLPPTDGGDTLRLPPGSSPPSEGHPELESVGVE